MPKMNETQWKDALVKLKTHCKTLKIKAISKPNEMKLMTKLTYECLQCGHNWQSTMLFGINSVAGCPKCFRLRLAAYHSEIYKGRTPANKLSHKDFVNKMAKENPRLKVVGKYVTNNSQIKVKCKECGFVYSTYPSNALRYGCSKCAKCRKKSTKEHKAEVTAINPNIELISEYITSRTPAIYRCNLCKFEWNYLPTNMLRKCVCPSCDTVKLITFKAQKKFYKLRSQGELYALKYMLKFFKANDIDCDLSQGTPKIQLKNRKHRPDFYIKSRNTLVEVKSLATLGVGTFSYGDQSGSLIFSKIKNNYKRAIAAGFNYKLLVFNGYQQLVVPKNWYDMSYSEISAFFIK